MKDHPKLQKLFDTKQTTIFHLTYNINHNQIYTQRSLQKPKQLKQNITLMKTRIKKRQKCFLKEKSFIEDTFYNGKVYP